MENLPLPKNFTVEAGPTPNSATFTIEPCFPGYGATLGNALRRVLLSSLPGAAITAVKIEGVEHEFSTLPHVAEDVVAMLLNLKGVRFRLHGDEPITVTLDVSGEKVVTAGDITKNAQAEVVNPAHPIATLTDSKGTLQMELTVGPGRGYVPVENREKERLPLGTIAVDSTYTPVKNVTFDVEHVRVEQITNFDRLRITVTTDGTLSPVAAVNRASGILVDHFAVVRDRFPEDTPHPAKPKRKPKAETTE
jgi:DNA-directed RNA polymerase subunit alpha